MSYAAAVDQLNAMVPELYQSSGQPRRKFSLEEIRILLSALGDPQRCFPAVLIAGTNGKGSTAATLASILTASGKRTGLYTSPHLARVNERIRLGRAEIDDQAFAHLYFRVHDAAQQLVLDERLPQLPSFFEILTAQALLYFAETHVDIAVLEVGMGGRLDATNIVDPLLSVITDISLDHTEWLGSTITAITREKAGILRRNGTLITLPQHPEANQVLGEVALELGVRGVSAVPYMPPVAAGSSGPYSVQALGAAVVVDSALIGAHQHRNLALAIAAAVELAANHGFPITPAAIAEGIHETRWPARLERIQKRGITWVLDVAHNPAGAWALRAGLNSLLSEDGKPRILIFSCLRDKPVAEMAQILFPLFDQVIVAPMHTARAAAIPDILAAAEATGTPARVAESVSDALQMAETKIDNGVIVVSGSVYLVGDARSLLLLNEPMQDKSIQDELLQEREAQP
ncbi:MAG: bifunctional folylpolyglutamate synthase/dihydrofolate synthase [Terracidiphilus sp.]